MNFSISIIWTGSFPILGLLGGIFHFYLNFKRKLLWANSEESDQTPRFAASDLILHCLPMSYKKDARLIWVKRLTYWRGLILAESQFSVL